MESDAKQRAWVDYVPSTSFMPKDLRGQRRNDSYLGKGAMIEICKIDRRIDIIEKILSVRALKLMPSREGSIADRKRLD